MRKLFALAVVALFGLPLFATETACFPQSACDGSYAFYCWQGNPPCGGEILDDGLTWVSGPIDGLWIDFPKERTWRIDPRDSTGRKLRGRIISVEVAISATQNHVSAANIGGNNAQWRYSPSDQTLEVQNDTCQDYFAYIIVRSSLEDPADAAVDADAALPDASPDASGDDAAADVASE